MAADVVTTWRFPSGVMQILEPLLRSRGTNCLRKGVLRLDIRCVQEINDIF